MGLTLNETFLAVFCALAILSLVATGAGQWITTRTMDTMRRTRMAIVNSRVRSSWSVLALFTVAFVIGPNALLIVFALASFFALREFVSLTPIKPSDHWALVVAFYFVIPAQYLLLFFGRANLFTVFIPVYVFLLMPVVMAVKRDQELYLQRVAKVQWGLMISVYCISHAPAIATLPIRGYEGRGALLLLFFLLILFVTDLLQVIASNFFGGAALEVSPNKTRNGVLAGGSAGILIGTALGGLTPFLWWQALLMSGLIVVSGYLGTVVLSLVKRSLGAKVWDSNLVLTRGVLERFDALTFAAPVFWQVT
ncbi:MAG: phosphatidate cytidylyltransferase, partial [Burkholderiaceae bacterium]|nr:phosphatidate cytidylyltransferase [Burkholderiaceae bacterium]